MSHDIGSGYANIDLHAELSPFGLTSMGRVDRDTQFGDVGMTGSEFFRATQYPASNGSRLRDVLNLDLESRPHAVLLVNWGTPR
jgi:hypothetical protein